jgi:hypothetical protein
MKFIPHALAALALAVSLALAFVSWSTVDRLERIDRRLDGITTELTTIKSPEYQQTQFNERLSRVLDEVRRRQEIALAHTQ